MLEQFPTIQFLESKHGPDHVGTAVEWVGRRVVVQEQALY